jgi:hypothetical protein
VLGIGLSSVTNRGDKAFERDGAAVGEAGGERLLLHEVGENTGIGGETGKGKTKMLVDSNNLFLVGGEFFCVALEAS